MPLEDVEALVMQRASELEQELARQGSRVRGPTPSPAAAPAPGAAPAAAAPGAPPVPNDDAGPTPIDKPTVKAATAALVAAGLLPTATDTITPEVLAVLQRVAEAEAPGLYDLTDERQLKELLDGIASGSIPVAAPPGSAPAGGAGAQPPVGGGGGGAALGGPLGGAPAGGGPLL